MRQLLCRILAIMAVSVFAVQLSAQNPNNPIQIALLRWYQASTANALPLENTCIGPEGVLFDGAHMWVGCFGSNEIQEYNANDAGFVQKVTLPHAPGYLLYDGANVWVANPGAGTVSEVQASTGTVVQNITVGTNPRALAFDGQYIYVTNSNSGSLSKILATTGAVITTIPLSGACTNPTAIAYDTVHSTIWIACNAAPLGPWVIELNPSNGAIIGTTAGLGSSPFCLNMAYDGANMWLANMNSSTVVEVNTSTLGLTTVSLPPNADPASVAFDGLYIWVAREDGNVTKLLPGSPTTIVGTWPSGGGEAFGIAFDGGNAWVTTPLPNTHGAYTISKM